MKETILKRLKKYNMGGMPTMPVQPMPEMLENMTGPTGPAYPTLEPGVIAGNAPNPISSLMNLGKTIYNNRQTISNIFTPKKGVDTSIFAGKLQMGGVEPLPGGVVAPIPGSDAVEFMGNKHNESGMGSDSGIMVDQQTEVEDGETMDQVSMKHGGKRDYFFSSYLKKGGKSYADMHKNILAMGGSQEDINMLARMQEKAAGRDPNQVAKLGGVVQYDTGGVNINLDAIMDQYPTYSEEIYNPNILTEQLPQYQNQMELREQRRPPIAEQRRRMFRNLQTFIDRGQTLSPEQQGQYNELSSDPFVTSPELVKLEPITIDGLQRDNYFQSSIKPPPPPVTSVEMPETEITLPKMSEEEIALANSDADTYDSYLARIEMSGELPNDRIGLFKRGILSEEQFNKRKEREQNRLARKLNPGMPLEAKIAAGVQLLPAITAAFTKPEELTQYDYEPGFTSPIMADRVKGQKFDAPTQDAARASLARAYQGQQENIDTAGLGPGSQSNRQALFAKKIEGLDKIGAREAADKLKAETMTKQSQFKADAMNAANELKAATINAQMIQKEAMRKQAVDAANTQMANQAEIDKIQKRLNIVTNLSQSIAGIGGDLMAYKSQERLAKAMGSDGIYQRDIMSRYLKSQNPNMSDDEINKLTLETLKKLAS
tara:strand:+ start:1421 stop:3394 length:1974 start_codon:yes stop_codon:yes gene_type:complete